MLLLLYYVLCYVVLCCAGHTHTLAAAMEATSRGMRERVEER
jgi:hypothetical protein